MIRQGAIYWLDFGKPQGSAPAKRRPAVVVQQDRFNRSTISTVVVAAITSTERFGDAPGSVRLREGEGGLPDESVVNVSQLRTIDRKRLRKRIGELSSERTREILRGVALLLGTDEALDS